MRHVSLLRLHRDKGKNLASPRTIMGLYTDNAAHEGRMSIDPRPIRHSPVPPHMPVVVVLPAGSRGLRTPGGREVEPLVLTPWALIDRPTHIEDAGRITGRITSPPNRPLEGVGVR